MSDKSPSEYRVGDCKPPLETRWRSGQSGNPGGRKPGSRSFRDAFLRAAIAKPVRRHPLEEFREPTQFDQAIARLFEAAMNGNMRALKELIALGRDLMPMDEAPGATSADATEVAPPQEPPPAEKSGSLPPSGRKQR